MTVRHFDWRDLAALHRWRAESVFMDSALVLTRGPLLVQGALLSYLAPTAGVFTGVSDGVESDHPVIGQVMHFAGSSFAHLTFVTPDAGLESQALPELLDFLIVLCGERGALRLIAEVDESTHAYQALRRSSFAIYTRQRIWRLTDQPSGKASPSGWRSARNQDAIAIRSLYNNVVPGLVQQVEPYVNRRPSGMVLYQGGNLIAFVELKSGHQGIWAQPFIHPDVHDVREPFTSLFQKLSYHRMRPLYICVRSYQSWLDSAVEDLGADAGSLQAVMVKHLAIAQKTSWAYSLPALDGGQSEITASIRVEEPMESYGTTQYNR